MSSPSSTTSTTSENKFNLTIEVPKHSNGLREIINTPQDAPRVSKLFFRQVYNLFDIPINISICHVDPFNEKAKLKSI
jgi:hypothetical protein